MTAIDDRADAREALFIAVRALAASAEPIQSRLVTATGALVQVTIDQFDGDVELSTKFARILDLLAIDEGDLETAIPQTAAHLTDREAIRVADLICDLF
jgi:hypothetical protein